MFEASVVICCAFFSGGFGAPVFNLGDCLGRGASVRCVGLGPNTTEAQPFVEHLELSSITWTPTKQVILTLFPNIQVGLIFVT
jgi:hypothetical protein